MFQVTEVEVNDLYISEEIGTMLFKRMFLHSKAFNSWIYFFFNLNKWRVQLSFYFFFFLILTKDMLTLERGERRERERNIDVREKYLLPLACNPNLQLRQLIASRMHPKPAT